MKNELFEIIIYSCGHGIVTIDGSLGYSDATPNNVVGRKPLDEYKKISAHSPSVVTVDLKKPAMLSGLLNCSATMDMSNIVEFWVDWNYVGNTMIPGDTTREIYLEPGKHELRISSVENKINHRHSVWLLKETEKQEKSDLKVIIPLFYPEEKCYDMIRIAASAARKNNVWIDVYGPGKQFVDFSQAKVLNAIEKIKEFSDDYKYIMLCDCHDTGIIKDSKKIIESFNRMSKDIVIGSEKGCWPVYCQEWKDGFPDRENGRKFANAGVWIGKRDRIIELLEYFSHLYMAMKHNSMPEQSMFPFNIGNEEDPSSLWYHRGCVCDDQFLWHGIFIHAREYFNLTIDYDFEIIANLIREDNPYDAIEKHSPCILHCAQWTKAHMHQMLGQLDCLE